MSKRAVHLTLAIVALVLLTHASPTLTNLAHAAVPLIVAVGAVAAVLRLVWYVTRRY